MSNDIDGFKELLGEELIFFNKDKGTDEVYRLRKQSLEHDTECTCEDCTKLNLLQRLGLG